jgi:acetoacetate decarboxylase
VNAPAFLPGPHRFLDREYLTIVYRSDPEALRRVVPEPLEIAEPLVRFEVMRMPDSTAVGDYTESGQVVAVTYNGERGEFNLGMYLDNLPAIAGGREADAFPKKLGTPRLFVDSDTVVGTLDYGSLRVATATMGYKHRELDPAQARGDHRAHLPAQDPSQLRRQATHLRARPQPDHRDHGQRSVDQPGASPAVRARARSAGRPSRT